jgi:hypothetical protein
LGGEFEVGGGFRRRQEDGIESRGFEGAGAAGLTAHMIDPHVVREAEQVGARLQQRRQGAVGKPEKGLLQQVARRTA